jgi:hypothetical protein
LYRKVPELWVLGAGWENRYLPRIVLAIPLASVGIAFRRHFLAASLSASVVYGALQVMAMAVRADSIESR